MAQPALASVPVDDGSEDSIRARLMSIVGRLQTLATERVAKREPIERRWLEDLEMYWGQYDIQTQRALQATGGSSIFVNQTRSKTDALAARLSDMLFPTDDRNWGIQPTPVPALTDEASAVAQAARQLEEATNKADAAAAQGGQPDPQVEALRQRADVAKRAAAELQGRIKEAQNRAKMMQEEIDDQLKESAYHALMRDMIEDACKLGSGIVKGPIVGGNERKGWKPQPDGTYKLVTSEGNTPGMRYVDPWNFFPDMNVRDIRDGEGNMERHLLNKKQMRQLSRMRGFDKDAFRRLLSGTPRTAPPTYLERLRTISQESSRTSTETYTVWEYSGPLTVDEMRDIALAMGDEATVADMAEIDDPLMEVNAIVWFCDGECLKFAIYPMDSGESLYSVFSPFKDESSVFGHGIPRIVRDPQLAIAAACRALMDNAGRAAGPQMVIHTEVEPENGNWKIEPWKIWRSKAATGRTERMIDVLTIPSMQAELTNIIALFTRFLDDMSSMPALAQGEQGSGVTKTAQGMALLFNSANVIFRRIVRIFDDDVTVPNIRRLYDWNMQFSPKTEIKGDYQVDARGSSVLLVRELQSQNLMWIATNLGAHPVYGLMLRNRDLLRRLFQAMMIPADDVVLSDDEIDAVLAKAAAAAQEAAKQGQDDGSADAAKAQMVEIIEANKRQIAEMKDATDRYKADRAYDLGMERIGADLNKNLETLDAKGVEKQQDRDAQERRMAVEAAMTQRTGMTAGGSV